jgi:hypothetical protein
MKLRPIQTELLEKYLKGICTIEEKRVVEDWYFDLDGDESESASPVPAFEKMELFEKIKQHVDDFEGEEQPSTTKVIFFSAA